IKSTTFREAKKAPALPGLQVCSQVNLRDHSPRRSDFYPKHKSHKWLSKKRRSLSKKRHSRRTPLLASRNLKNSDGQTSSKNCSLNRDVECPSVGTIFAQ